MNGANLTAEFLTEVVKHHGEQISNIGGEIIKVTLTNAAGEAFLIIPQRRLHCLSTETVLTTQ